MKSTYQTLSKAPQKISPDGKDNSKDNKKDSQTLLLEDLERWRGESPAAGHVTAAQQQAQKISDENSSQTLEQDMADESSRDLPLRRNSADQVTPDVTAQNWSAEKLAGETVYVDEAQLKAQMKTGKKIRAANAS